MASETFTASSNWKFSLSFWVPSIDFCEHHSLGISQTLWCIVSVVFAWECFHHWSEIQSCLKVSESEVTQSCPTLCYPMDCSLPGSSVHGIFQARVLEWVAISFSRGSSWPRDWTRVPCIQGEDYTMVLSWRSVFQRYGIWDMDENNVRVMHGNSHWSIENKLTFNVCYTKNKIVRLLIGLQI